MSSRAHLYRTIQDYTGALVLTDALVTIYEPGTTTLIAETIYQDGESGLTYTNGYHTTTGVISFYLAFAKRVDLSIQVGVQSPLIIPDLDVSLATTAGGDVIKDSNSTLFSPSLGASTANSATNCVVLGKDALSTGNEQVVVGDGAQANSTQNSGSVVIGSQAVEAPATWPNSGSNVIVGQQATVDANSYSAVAIGYVAVVRNASDGATAVGTGAEVHAHFGTAVGSIAIADDAEATALGENTTAWSNHSTALGSNATTTADGGTAVGVDATAGAGFSSTDKNTTLGATAVGTGAWARSNMSTAVGDQAGANGNESTSLGANSYAQGVGSTALGYNTATNSHTQSTAVGAYANNTADHQIMMGTSTETVVVPGSLAVEAEAINTVVASGATQTLPAGSTATMHALTLTANCALTFPTAVAGASLTLFLKQDATGSRTVTWPASVKWAGGTAPTLTTTASKTDAFSFVSPDGTNWLGFVAGQAF